MPEPSNSRGRKERSNDAPSREARPEKPKSKRHDPKRERTRRDPPTDDAEESDVKVIAMPPPKRVARRGKRAAQRMIINKLE